MQIIKDLMAFLRNYIINDCEHVSPLRFYRLFLIFKEHIKDTTFCAMYLEFLHQNPVISNLSREGELDEEEGDPTSQVPNEG